MKDSVHRLVTGIAELFVNKPDNSQTTAEVTSLSGKLEDIFENRSALHFCNKCGWCDTMPTTMRKITRPDDNGVPEVTYMFLDTDTPVDCTRCAKKSVYPMCNGTSLKAVVYLLKALQ